MRPIPLIILQLGLVGCLGRQPEPELTTIAERFIQAAAKGDSLAIAGMTTGDRPRMLISTVRHREPDLLAAAAKGLEPRTRAQLGDSVQQFYRFPYGRGEEVLAVGFVRERGGWLIYHISFPERQ